MKYLGNKDKYFTLFSVFAKSSTIMAKLRPFSEELILKRIRLENPLWESLEIPSFYKTLKPRLYFDLLYNQVTLTEVRRATVLMGPRRVGKTVMLYQVVQKLIENGVPESKICFISIDAPIYNNKREKRKLGVGR